MTNEPPFDVSVAHKYFSATCFNSAWELIDKESHTAEENEQMIRLVQASIWHWTQRDDCTPKNLSVGYWQASRVYVLTSQPENALHYAQLCLEVTPPGEFFYLGFANEALARAESIAGNHEKMNEYLAEARKLAESITDPEEQKMLLGDLETIK